MVDIPNEIPCSLIADVFNKRPATFVWIRRKKTDPPNPYPRKRWRLLSCPDEIIGHNGKVISNKFRNKWIVCPVIKETNNQWAIPHAYCRILCFDLIVRKGLLNRMKLKEDYA